jgi:hypothetical protein
MMNGRSMSLSDVEGFGEVHLDAVSLHSNGVIDLTPGSKYVVFP